MLKWLSWILTTVPSGWILHDRLLHRLRSWLRCDEIISQVFVAILVVNLSVKEVWKLVNIWRSYGQYCSALFFGLTVYSDLAWECRLFSEVHKRRMGVYIYIYSHPSGVYEGSEAGPARWYYLSAHWLCGDVLLSKYHHFEFYRQHCAKRKAPVAGLFKLLRGRFWGFSSRRGDTLHR